MNTGEEAVHVANAIERVCAGHSTAACYMAIAMVLGRAEARARKPDLAALLGLVSALAGETFMGARNPDSGGETGGAESGGRAH